MNEHIMSEKERLFIEAAKFSLKYDFPFEFTNSLTPVINVNDVFAWNLPDGVAINSFEDLADLEAQFKLTELGDLLWACKKRKKRPQGAYYKHIPEKDRHLFDACGPERAVDFDNPVQF